MFGTCSSFAPVLLSGLLSDLLSDLLSLRTEVADSSQRSIRFVLQSSGKGSFDELVSF